MTQDASPLVERHTILSVIVGSRAFGLATADSDTDRRGVYAAPTEDFWLLDKPPAHLDGPRPEQFSWEAERFCTLALAGNPGILEALHSPLVERLTPLGEELRDLSGAFLSRQVHRTYGRYAAAQLAKAEVRRRRGAGVRGKPLMHLLRLLISGAGLLETGSLTLDVGEHRDRLLAVRRGEVPWEEITAWAGRLESRLDAAYAAGPPLPDRPDRARVERWLVSVRRRCLTGEATKAGSAP